MPKYTQFAFEFLAVLHRFHQIVDTQELVILGNDLDGLVFKQDKVLNVVD